VKAGPLANLFKPDNMVFGASGAGLPPLFLSFRILAPKKKKSFTPKTPLG
jgi:hypothetical protein